MAKEEQEYAVAVTFGSEPKIRAVLEAAREKLLAEMRGLGMAVTPLGRRKIKKRVYEWVLEVQDNRFAVIARWNPNSGWTLYPGKPKKGPALFYSPFTIHLKAGKPFVFPRKGHETFVVRAT